LNTKQLLITLLCLFLSSLSLVFCPFLFVVHLRQNGQKEEINVDQERERIKEVVTKGRKDLTIGEDIAAKEEEEGEGEGQILTEIQKFRLRQAERDKKLEQERREKLQARIKQSLEEQKVEEERKERELKAEMDEMEREEEKKKLREKVLAEIVDAKVEELLAMKGKTGKDDDKDDRERRRSKKDRRRSSTPDRKRSRRGEERERSRERERANRRDREREREREREARRAEREREDRERESRRREKEREKETRRATRREDKERRKGRKYEDDDDDHKRRIKRKMEVLKELGGSDAEYNSDSSGGGVYRYDDEERKSAKKKRRSSKYTADRSPSPLSDEGRDLSEERGGSRRRRSRKEKESRSSRRRREESLEEGEASPIHDSEGEQRSRSHSAEHSRKEREGAPAEAAVEGEASTSSWSVVETPANEGPKLGFGFQAKLGSATKAPVKSVFGNDEDENKLKPLIPIDYSEEEKLAAPAGSGGEGKKEGKSKDKDRQKDLVDKIPKDKRELFKYPVDWEIVDKHDIIRSKLKAWIVKKIVEFLGEEEETLIDFICSKLIKHSDPESILEELKLVLDDDAEIFMVKLWRMLIFHVLRLSS